MTIPVSINFRISEDELANPQLASERLNQILAHIFDRLDQLQSLRGDFVNRGQILVQDSDGNEIAGFKNT